MDYSLETLGFKLYGLYTFSKLGLFSKKFVILADITSKEEIIQKLQSHGFKDQMPLAIRFSKENAMHLPRFLGTFTLDAIAEIIMKERKDFVPFVHELITPKNTGQLFYDGNTIFVELWPGIGGGKTSNEFPDKISIVNNKVRISRYKKSRKAENVQHEISDVEPYDFDYLCFVGRKIHEIKDRLEEMYEHFSPLLCDFHFDEEEMLYFMGVQKTDNVNSQDHASDSDEEYYLVHSLEDLKAYDNNKKIFLDIAQERDDHLFGKIVALLKNYSEVYVKSLTMHLAVILREAGIVVKLANVSNDYEIREINLE